MIFDLHRHVGGGTAVGGTIHLLAGQMTRVDVATVRLVGAGAAANYSITIASVTATVNITAIWSERQ